MQDHQKHARDLFDRARAGDQNAMRELVKVREDAARGDDTSRKVYDYLVAYGREHPVGYHPVGYHEARHPVGYHEARHPVGYHDACHPVAMGAEERHALGILRAADQNDPRAVMWALHRIPTFGHATDTVRAACVALSRQNPWTDPRLSSFEGLLPDEPRRVVFRHAIRCAPHKRKIEELRSQIPAGMHGETSGTLCAGYCLGTARKFQVARLPKSPVSVIGVDIGWECGEDTEPYSTNDEIQSLVMGVRG